MLRVVELLPLQLLGPGLARALPPRALVNDPVAAREIMLLLVQHVDALQRKRQRLVAHVVLELVLAEEDDLLHERRAVALALPALDVLGHVLGQARGRAAVVGGRADGLGERDGVEERAVGALAQHVAHVEDGVAEEGDVLRGPGPDGLALAHHVHVGRVGAGHAGELGEARVDGRVGDAGHDLGFELARRETVGRGAAVLEEARGRADAEHDVGLLGLDREGCVAGCVGGERVLPGAEEDVLVVVAKGLVVC